MVDFMIQLIGIFGAACGISSFQCKSNRNFFLLQGMSGVFFATQFLLTGAWAGLLYNALNIIRAVVCECFNKTPRLRNLILLESLMVGAALCSMLVFHEVWWLVAFVVIAQSTGTFMMWTRDGRKVRLGQFWVVSPGWLLYDLLIPVPSIGGILTEVFNMGSVIVSFIRFRKSGFEKA